MTYSITSMIASKWGKHVGIAPRTDGALEIYNKKSEFLGVVSFYKKWKCYVWEQECGIIMSESCMKEVFELAKEYKKLD